MDDAATCHLSEVFDDSDRLMLLVPVYSGLAFLILLLLRWCVKRLGGDGDAASELLEAAGRGDLKRVRRLLDKKQVGVNVHTVNDNGSTPLHCAAIDAHAQVAEFLLSRGARVDATTEECDSSTPLHCACACSIERTSSLQVVELLIKHDANVNAVSKTGYTPLHCAGQAGQLEVVKLLLENGAKFDAIDENNKTPLMLAKESNHAEVVSVLEEKEKNHVSHPSMWAISYDQLMDIHRDASDKFGAEYKNFTMYDMNERIITPLCQREKTSYALHLNPEGLKVGAFITHAWKEPFRLFIESIERVYGTSVTKPNLWICSFALKQGDEKETENELDVPLDEAPFVRALEEATTFVVVRNPTTDIYGRIWCVCELMYAKKFGLVPDRTHVTGPDSFSHSTTSCLDATAFKAKDKERILAGLISKDHSREDIDSFSREDIDNFINQFRVHPWTDRASTDVPMTTDATYTDGETALHGETSPERSVIHAYFAMQCQPSKLIHNLDGRPQLLANLHKIAHFLSKAEPDSDSTRGFEDLFERQYKICLTEGARKHAEKALASSHVRVFFWCARGINECSKTQEHLSVNCFGGGDKPEVVIVCMEFGARHIAEKIHRAMKVRNVIAMCMDPYGNDLTSLFKTVFLPFCASYLSGRYSFKACAEELKGHANIFNSGCDCDFYCLDKDSETLKQEVSLIRQQPVPVGAKLDVESVPCCSFISLFPKRSLKQLKVDTDDLDKLEFLIQRLCLDSKEGHTCVYLKPNSQTDQGPPLEKACERSRALAFYACCDIASTNTAGGFHSGIVRVDSEETKLDATKKLSKQSEAALVWLDLAQSPRQKAMFSQTDELREWIDSFGGDITVAILLTSNSDSFRQAATIVNSLKELKVKMISVELKKNARGLSVPVNSLVGTFSINALPSNVHDKKDCLLDRLENAQMLAQAIKDEVLVPMRRNDPMFDDSLYRGDDSSVKIRFFIRNVDQLVMLRDKILTGKAAESLNEKLPQENGHIEFDLTSVAIAFESMILQLETLTPHQQQKLTDCQDCLSGKKRLIIKGAAGTGKTFIALNHVLEYLESEEGYVLYVCSNKSLGFYFCRWLCQRVCHGDKIDFLSRIYILSYEGKNLIYGIVHNQCQGLLEKKEIDASNLKFEKVIVDEAHDVFQNSQGGHRSGLKQAVDDLLSKQEDYDLILLSDESQATVPDVERNYPTSDEWAYVNLTQVCRSTKRLLLGARCFQLGNLDEADVVHGSDGLPLKAILFAQPKKKADSFKLYAEKICEMVKDVLEKFPGLDLHDRLAIVVPDNAFRLALCAEDLSEMLLSINAENGKSLVLAEAAQAACKVNTGDELQKESSIVLDTVAQMAGLEYLIVFGVGLDASLFGDSRRRLVCTRIYRAITRAQIAFYLINEKVEDGWFAWLERIKNENIKADSISLSGELSELSTNSALALVEMQEERISSLPFEKNADSDDHENSPTSLDGTFLGPKKNGAPSSNRGESGSAPVDDFEDVVDSSDSDGMGDAETTASLEDENAAEAGDQVFRSNVWDTSGIKSRYSGNPLFQPTASLDAKSHDIESAEIDNARHRLRSSAAQEKSRDVAGLNRLGVSVHHIVNTFLAKVETAGHNRDSRLYEIEDLNGPPGVIRQLGGSIICPLDGMVGASYVHCLAGDDNRGPANFVFNYTWSYPIGAIIDTLDAYCSSKKLNRKRTYIWLDCLCTNQHRIVEQRQLKKKRTEMSLAPVEDFVSDFRELVAGIGHVLAMMEPWYAPVSLTRIWNIYELHTAFEMGCDVSIVMPPREKNALVEALVGRHGNVDRLYEALATTRIQNAYAEVEADLLQILDLVASTVGFAEFNNRVNELLRACIRQVILEAVEAQSATPTEESMSTDPSRSETLPFALVCANVGMLFYRNGEYEGALDLFQKCLAMNLSVNGTNHPDTATCYNNIGLVIYAKGDYDSALVEFRKALAIRELVLGKKHPDTAVSYNGIGQVLEKKGEYDGALMEYRKALAISESVSGKHHPKTAESYLNIGKVLEEQGAYDGALVEYRKALAIQEAVLGNIHPNTAVAINSIGMVLKHQGDYDGALMEFRKALAIRESVLGKQHPDTAVSYNDIGMVLDDIGNYNAALAELRKALAIRESALGMEHPDTAASYNAIGLVLEKEGKFDEALVELRKAFAIRESLFGDHHPSMAASFNNIGMVLYKKGDFDGALVEYRKAFAVRESVLGRDHPDTATSYNNIGSVLLEMGDVDGALVELRKALAIKESIFGRDHPSTATSYDDIGQALADKGEFDGALVEFRKALKIRESVLGKNHPYTMRTFEQIEAVLSKQWQLDP